MPHDGFDHAARPAVVQVVGVVTGGGAQAQTPEGNRAPLTAAGLAPGGRPGKIGRPKYPAGVVLVFAVLADAAGPERATFFLAFFAGTQRARALG